MPLHSFNYQSSDIHFSDWISLITLCLAPLVAHVAAGAPQPSYLTYSRTPKWHDRICHYNPTSILWRYFAIADRRLRARGWDVADIAAANALFWTDAGWDGSERVAEESLSFCSRLPAHARTEVFSWDMIKTIVIGLQAAQAFYSIGGSLFGPGISDYIYRFALDSIFLPIGCLGLYRFCVAFWITENFAFINVSDPMSIAVGRLQVLPERRDISAGNKPSAPETDVQMEVTGRLSIDSFLEHPTRGEHHASRFFPTSQWSSRTLRIVWMLPLLTLTAFCVIFVAPWPFWNQGRWAGAKWGLPASAFSMVIFYLVIFGFSSLILLYYFIRGANTTTIIPCVSMLWYKIYTVFISFAMVLSVLMVALETARTPCGTYSVWPPENWGGKACSQSVLPIGQEESRYFGLAFRSRESSRTTDWLDNEFRVLNVTGVCLVATWSEVTQRAAGYGMASTFEG